MVQETVASATKRRGRLRAYDPEATLRQVRDAFWKSGYSGTSLDADFEARFRRARAIGELPEDADIAALATLATATLHTLAVRARGAAACEDLRHLARKAVKTIIRS